MNYEEHTEVGLDGKCTRLPFTFDKRLRRIDAIVRHIELLRGCLRGERETFYFGSTDDEYPIERFRELNGITIEEMMEACLGHLREHVARLQWMGQ